MKSTILLSVSIIIFTALGAVYLPVVFSGLTGRDSISISGIIAGFFLSLVYTSKSGQILVLPSFISALIITTSLLCVSFWASNIFEGFSEKIWPLSIGFAILSGTVLGLLIGKHITNRLRATAL